MDKKIKTLFFLESFMLVISAIVLWYSFTPTNVIQSSVIGQTISNVSILISVGAVIAGIPLGVIGLRTVKNMGKMKNVMRTLSIFNLLVGLFEAGIFLLILFLVLVGMRA